MIDDDEAVIVIFAAFAMQALIAKSTFQTEPQTYEVYQKTAIGACDYAEALHAELSRRKEIRNGSKS